jgi:hypothetical protein
MGGGRQGVAHPVAARLRQQRQQASPVEIGVGGREDGDGQQDDEAAGDAESRQHGRRGLLGDRRGGIGGAPFAVALANQLIGPLVLRQHLPGPLGEPEQPVPQLVQLVEELRHHRHADDGEKRHIATSTSAAPRPAAAEAIAHCAREPVEAHRQQQPGEHQQQHVAGEPHEDCQRADQQDVVGAQPAPPDLGAAVADRRMEWWGLEASADPSSPLPAIEANGPHRQEVPEPPPLPDLTRRSIPQH